MFVSTPLRPPAGWSTATVSAPEPISLTILGGMIVTTTCPETVTGLIGPGRSSLGDWSPSDQRVVRLVAMSLWFLSSSSTPQVGTSSWYGSIQCNGALTAGVAAAQHTSSSTAPLLFTYANVHNHNHHHHNYYSTPQNNNHHHHGNFYSTPQNCYGGSQTYFCTPQN